MNDQMSRTGGCYRSTSGLSPRSYLARRLSMLVVLTMAGLGGLAGLASRGFGMGDGAALGLAGLFFVGGTKFGLQLSRLLRNLLASVLGAPSATHQ